jgi:putative membrane protein
MKRLLSTAALVCAIVAPACIAAPSQILSTDLSGADLTFFSGASQQIALVAGLSAMARDRAITPEIKDLAAGIATDQAAAAAHLKDLATRKQVPIDAEVDGAGKKQLQSLSKLKGAKFDKTYLDLLSDALDNLQQSLDPGSASTDADIKSLAQSSLATVKQERDRLRKLGI